MVTVTFDLTAEQVGELTRPRFRGPHGRLVARILANQLNLLAQRLAGPTTVEVSPSGLQVTTADASRRIPWSSVRWINERALCWAMQLAPAGLQLIPASAVPVAQRQELADLLRSAGPKYRVVEGGVPGADGVLAP